MMKLFLDFDGVVADSIKAICELYRQDYSLYDKYKMVLPEEIDTWEFKELTLNPPIRQYFIQARFFDVLEPMNIWCMDYIKELSEIFELYICTVGNERNVRGKTLWLDRHKLKDTKYEVLPVDFCGNKSSVDMDGG